MLAALLRVSVPAPALVMLPLVTAPASVVLTAVVKVRVPPPRLLGPLALKVSAPVPASPKVTSPPRVNALAKVRAVASSEEMVPPLSVTPPEPKAASAPARRTPAESVVPLCTLAVEERIKCAGTGLDQTSIAHPPIDVDRRARDHVERARGVTEIKEGISTDRFGELRCAGAGRGDIAAEDHRIVVGRCGGVT